MSDPIWRSPALDPSRVAEVLAFDLTAEELASLAPRIEPEEGGWAMRLRARDGDETELNAFCAGMDLDRARLVRLSAGGAGVSGVNLGAEMLSFLLRRDWINADDMPARSGERLIVAPPMSQEALVRLLDRLNAHATCCRAARFTPDAGGDPLTLFHLRDDPVRGATLQPFLEAWQGPAVPVLNAYATSYGTVFLPSAPPARMLTAVAALMDRQPELFGFRPPARDGWEPQALLFAVAQAAELVGYDTPDDASPDALRIIHRDTCFDIRSARFFGASAFSDRLRPAVVTAQPDGDADAALEDLKRALRAPENGFSFPLRLRPSQEELLSGDALDQLAALKAERALLDRRIGHVRARMAGQAVLAICDDAGLAGMIRVLRDCLAQSLSWEGIRYLHRNAEQGQHVFHFPAELATQIGLFAVIDRDPGVRWYWGDPVWTELYGRLSATQVMVPWQNHLHPLPHAWSPDQAEEHLHALLRDWSAGEVTLTPGDAHVVLFDATAGAGADLGVQVFAAQDFRAIDGEVVAWFNAVRTRLARLGDMDPLRAEENARIDAALALAREAQMAAPELPLDDLAQAEIEGRAGDGPALAGPEGALLGRITEAGDGLAKLTASGAQAIQAALEEELDGLLTRSRAQSAQIARLAELAEQIEARHDRAQALVDGMETQSKALASEVADSSRAQLAQLDRMLKTLKDRDRRFTAATETTGAQIQRMRDRVDRLNRLWFGGGGRRR